MKTGLVIQGPVFSPGFGPYKWTTNGVFKKEYIPFDSSENILQLVKVASPIFDEIIVVTWSSEYSSNVKRELMSTNITFLECNEELFLSEMSHLGHNIKSGNHKYHQIYTINLGTKELIKRNCQVMAKIRTDHFLDVNALQKAVKKQAERDFSYFGAPYLNLFELDRLTDFYFISHCHTMKELTQAYLCDSQINEDTHYDYFYKFTKYLVSNDNRNDNSFIRNQLSKRFFTYFVWTSYLYPIDLKVFKSLTWRGLKVNHRLNYWIRLFYTIKCTKGTLLIPAVVFNFFIINVLRVFHRLSGRSISFIQYRFSKFVNIRRGLDAKD